MAAQDALTPVNRSKQLILACRARAIADAARDAPDHLFGAVLPAVGRGTPVARWVLRRA